MIPKEKGHPVATGTAFHKNTNIQPEFYPTNLPIGNNYNNPDHNSSGFQDAIRAAGLESPGDIVPGKFQRFPGAGKRPSNRAGWCILFSDGLGGCFGDWSTGLSESWQAPWRKTPFSATERQQFQRRIAEARAQAEAERKKAWKAASERAREIWEATQPATNAHPYLIRKGIRVLSESRVRQRGGLLVLPVMDFKGALTSLQFIGPDGNKRLLSGGRKQGCFIPIQGDISAPRDPDTFRIILCEGWATGCTLAEDEPETVEEA